MEFPEPSMKVKLLPLFLITVNQMKLYGFLKWFTTMHKKLSVVDFMLLIYWHKEWIRNKSVMWEMQAEYFWALCGLSRPH